MRVFHDEEYQECRDKEIYQCGYHFAVQDSSIGKVFDMLHSELGQDRLQDERSDEVFDQSLDERSHLGRDKQSDSDAEDIILGKEGHEFFEHSPW